MAKRSSWRTWPDLWRKLKPIAREMRKEPTAAERKLWQRIHRRQVLGVKFRRQLAIDHFIVDFCSLTIRLIIEVDGPTHIETQEEDAVRQEILESLDFEVVRFTNRDVLGNINGAMATINDVVGRRLTGS